ncbi:unnamed protein product [Phaeothamnion confervicola]
MSAVARALEIIPRQLADNAGFDATDLLNRLRQKHHRKEEDGAGKWFGVDVDEEGICDTFARGVWEPAMNKRNCLRSACEAACMILSIDETVRHPQSEKPGAPSQGVGLGRGGGGGPVSAAMGGGGMAGMMGAGRGGRRGVKMMRGRGGA